jgi:signal transduction histidine kinase
MDISLSSAMVQAIQNLDIENGNLAFQNVEKTPVHPLSPTHSNLLIRILDEQGSILHQSNGFPDIPVDLKTSAPGVTSSGTDKSSNIQTVKQGNTSYRVITTVFSIPSLQKRNTVQIADTMAKIDEELSSFILRFLVGLPFVLLIAAAGGLFLANKALKPIVAMRNLATRVREDRLSDRLDYHGPDDEFGSLAAAFDSMLDRLETSFKREKRFSADASHELKTPLTALKGKLDVTLSRARTAKEYQETLVSMRTDVERLISLSQDLLLLSRMGNVAISARAEHIDLAELLDSCMDQIITTSPDKSITVKRNYADRLTIWGVRDYLVRLFLNILDNAVKFADGKPEISISICENKSTQESSDTKGMAVVDIEDNGPGIPEADLPFLFEPFYRVESDRSRLRGGVGLGLAIAKEIVDAHGGMIGVNSEPGKGTIVSIQLPTSFGTPMQSHP